MKNLIGDLFNNQLFYSEIEEITKKFNIPFLGKFNQSDCEAYSLAFAGLEYCMKLGMDKIPDRVNLLKFYNFIYYFYY